MNVVELSLFVVKYTPRQFAKKLKKMILLYRISEKRRHYHGAFTSVVASSKYRYHGSH